jgi:hypothetical protein
VLHCCDFQPKMENLPLFSLHLKAF